MTATIRRATLEDAAGIARVHVDTWRTAYAGIVPEAVLAGLSYEGRATWWRSVLQDHADTVFVYVADEDGQIVGFVSGGSPLEETPGYTSMLYAIYLLQSTQGQGLGRRLVEALAKNLIEQGHTTMLLWVFRDNPSARGFYEALGGQVVAEKAVDFGGQELVEVSYGWQDIRPLGVKSE